MIIKDYLTNETKNIDVVSDRESVTNIRKVVAALVDMKDVHHIESIRIKDREALEFVFVVDDENPHPDFGSDLHALLKQQFGEWRIPIAILDQRGERLGQ